jgi:MGT family glycosyltransferase
LQAIISIAAKRFRSRVDQIREGYGLKPLTKPVHAFLGDMPLYLVRGTPGFDYSRKDLPPSVHYVGALLWSTKRNDEPARWLADLRRDEPVVHVTEGTMQSEPVLLKAAVAGLGGLRMQVIMTTGGNRDPKQLGFDGVASNIRVESWVSHEELLPVTDVVVTVGGAGTVLASLSAGAPVVVVPSESDQLDSARRAADSGAGIYLPRKKCSPRRLRAAVEEILGNPSYKKNAQRMSLELARYRGGERAAELLEEMAGHHLRASMVGAGL